MNAVLVSVIIPVYNRETLLADAIDSVLLQGYPTLEVIVVDDGSTDNTAMVAKGYGDRIRYAYQPNAGPAAARNRGLSMAKGEVIGFLDSDDQWTKDKLAYQLSYMAHHPSVEITLGYSQLMQQTMNETGKPQFEPHQNPKLVWQLGCGLYRRSVFTAVGVFNGSMRFWEDEDWFRRAREHGIKIVCLTHTTQLLRYHDQNMTRDMAAGNPDLLKFLKGHRNRMREREGGKSIAL